MRIGQGGLGVGRRPGLGDAVQHPLPGRAFGQGLHVGQGGGQIGPGPTAQHRADGVAAVGEVGQGFGPGQGGARVAVGPGAGDGGGGLGPLARGGQLAEPAEGFLRILGGQGGEDHGFHAAGGVAQGGQGGQGGGRVLRAEPADDLLQGPAAEVALGQLLGPGQGAGGVVLGPPAYHGGDGGLTGGAVFQGVGVGHGAGGVQFGPPPEQERAQHVVPNGLGRVPFRGGQEDLDFLSAEILDGLGQVLEAAPMVLGIGGEPGFQVAQAGRCGARGRFVPQSHGGFDGRQGASAGLGGGGGAGRGGGLAGADPMAGAKGRHDQHNHPQGRQPAEAGTPNRPQWEPHIHGAPLSYGAGVDTIADFDPELEKTREPGMGRPVAIGCLAFRAA